MTYKCKMTEYSQRIASATSRDKGVIGSEPIVYSRLLDEFYKNHSIIEYEILDFGAGKTARHTSKLIKKGFKVIAYDLPNNSLTEFHQPDALERKYRIVLASNIINVIPDRNDLKIALDEIVGSVVSGGMLIISYPREPRKTDFSNLELFSYMLPYFRETRIVKGSITSSQTMLLVLNKN